MATRSWCIFAICISRNIRLFGYFLFGDGRQKEKKKLSDCRQRTELNSRRHLSAGPAPYEIRRRHFEIRPVPSDRKATPTDNTIIRPGKCVLNMNVPVTNSREGFHGRVPLPSNNFKNKLPKIQTE